MAVFIALIRGINVGGHKKIRMADLKASCEEMGLRDVRTHLQSGNVVFKSTKSNRAQLAKDIEAILGVEAKVILRSADELRKIIDANPMPEVAERGPSGFIVMFLDAKPAAAAMLALRDGYSGPEQMQLHGTELYIHYGAGMGQSKLTNALIERKLGVAGTSRNWNTVTKLLELAED
jgi:uncharacterized protein (DUF1697 family)